MSQVLAGRGGCALGRSLLTLANAITAVAPFAADWNDSHIFNKRCPSRAPSPTGTTATSGTPTQSGTSASVPGS